MASRIKQTSGSSTDSSIREAVAAILVCAAAADGSVLPIEADRLEDAIGSMRMFADCPQRELQALVQRLHGEASREGAIEVSRQASAFVPYELRLKVFGLAADLVFTDRRERSSERVFLENLRRALGISRSMADDVIRTMTIKYLSSRDS